MEALVTTERHQTKKMPSQTEREQQHALSLEERTDLTYAEVEAMGITEPFELIDGRITFKVSYPIHARYLAKVVHIIQKYLDEQPIGELFVDMNVRLFPDDDRQSRRPDVAFYLNEHVPQADNEPPTIAPDLAIEIGATNSDFLPLFEKAGLYLSKGSQVVWSVIPAKACVLVWKAQERTWEYNTLTCPELLPGWSLNLAEFFAQPQPASAQ
ncbi:Uma2 family endonuclease [candidate division KSB1 bacterium]|nr:Uma2 family endonuclease [candidate division KSB1 bacterium]